MTEFVARVIALRKQHPLLRETRFLFGDREVLPGLYDVGWFDERGTRSTIEAWQDPEGRALTLRRAGPGLNGETEVLLMMMNAIGANAAFRAARAAPGMACAAWIPLTPDALPYPLSAAKWKWRRTAWPCCSRSRSATPTGRLAGRPARRKGRGS